MKKKITALCLCVALLAVAVVGASLAYFTDTDKATNTFTVGKVDIKLNEVFDPDNAKLVPGSSSTTAIKKEVTISLEEGSDDAWVWVEQLIPAVLDSTDGSTGTNNTVHINAPGREWDKYRKVQQYWAADQTEALALEKTWDHDPETELGISVGPQGYFRQETIDGVVYNVYVILYHGKLTADDPTTTRAIHQVYLDSKVDTNEKGEYTINGDVIDYDFSKGVNIIMRAYAIQADGFDDVYAAYKAYNKLS